MESQSRGRARGRRVEFTCWYAVVGRRALMFAVKMSCGDPSMEHLVVSGEGAAREPARLMVVKHNFRFAIDRGTRM
jgi:hypothetical protein